MSWCDLHTQDHGRKKVMRSLRFLILYPSTMITPVLMNVGFIIIIGLSLAKFRRSALHLSHSEQDCAGSNQVLH